MKKYIIFAVVVLLSLTSCEVDNGTRRDEAQRLLAGKVVESIRVPLHFSKYLVYADLMLREKSDEANLLWRDESYKVELAADGDIVELKLMSGTTHVESYFINTMGGTLYQGAVWSLSHKKDDKVTELLTFTGVEGKEGCLTFNGEFNVSAHESVKHKIEIKYSFKNSNNWYSAYDVIVRGEGSVAETGQYTLDFEIEEHDPLTFYSYSYNVNAGSLFINYHDLVSNKSRDVVYVYGYNR